MVDATTAETQSESAASTKAPFVFKRQTKEDIIAAQQEAVVAQEHLAPQTLDAFDVTKVTPLNPEIIWRQATINIGTIGHVAHGKSTLVRAVSGTNVSDPCQVMIVLKLDNFCVDGPPLQRKAEKHYDQARLRERQALQVLGM